MPWIERLGVAMESKLLHSTGTAFQAWFQPSCRVADRLDVCRLLNPVAGQASRGFQPIFQPQFQSSFQQSQCTLTPASSPTYRSKVADLVPCGIQPLDGHGIRRRGGWVRFLCELKVGISIVRGWKSESELKPCRAAEYESPSSLAPALGEVTLRAEGAAWDFGSMAEDGGSQICGGSS